MSQKLSIIRTYEVENRVVAVPRSWQREAVAKWQTKVERRKIEAEGVRMISLSDKREFGDGVMPIARKIEMENFTATDLPFELI